MQNALVTSIKRFGEVLSTGVCAVKHHAMLLNWRFELFRAFEFGEYLSLAFSRVHLFTHTAVYI